MTAAKIGIIGGSGLYQMPELTDVDEIQLETPFGNPSDKFIIGTLENERVAFLPRHGRGHRLTPTEVPFRANIYAMKLLGVERILSASAVGSLQEKYAPLDMVIPDQFFDRTLALVTDYDCWHPGHDAVTVETVIEYLNKNVRNAQLIMKSAVKALANRPRTCKCGLALKNAIFTAPDLWPEATAHKLQAIIAKY